MRKEIRREIEKWVDAINQFLFILDGLGSYYKRKKIKMSDVELKKFVDQKKLMTIQMVIRGVAFEAFLEYEDSRDRRERNRDKRSMIERWKEYAQGIEDSITLKIQNSWVNPKSKLKEKSDEEYEDAGRQAAEAAEGTPGGDVAGQDRAVYDS